MEKKVLNKLDLDLYTETLDNGFRIFVIPQNNVNNIYVTLSTNYGSVQREFIPYGENDMVKVPDGVAHFLEHKMFEQKDGKDPFEYFGERGADANANTTNFKTTYLFSGSKFLEDNLNFLLDYVYSPYFTDENVEKEKGIIDQEIKMYEDDPYSAIYENMIYNTFVNHPIKIKVIGSHESVASITKEDLYTCYNTFYQPSNMFLVVTGNVKPKHVIDIVKKNMSKKKFGKPEKIVLKTYVEPNEVAVKDETIKMDVNVPKVGIGYKLDISNIDLPFKDIYNYISLFFDIKCGGTSLLIENLKKEHIINDELGITFVDTDKYICGYVLGETSHTKELISKIKETISDKSIDKKDFDRKIHATIASLISATDSIYSMNSKVMNNIIKYDRVELNDYDKIMNLSYDKMMEVINSLDFSNYLTYTINPK